MILSYKLCINMLIEPVNVDIKRTQTTNKTVRKYSNDKIFFTFFRFATWPLGEWLFSQFPPQETLCSVVSYTIIYEIKKLGLGNFS